MRKDILLALGLLIAASPAIAGSIYKCNTQEGVVFSQSPCAPDAVKLKSGTAQKSSQPTTAQSAPAAGSIDVRLFDEVGGENVDTIIATVGHPAARYTHDGTDRWLYSNTVKIDDGRRLSPELLLENGRHFQTTWIPEDVMRRSVKAAKRLASWRQPESVRDKVFLLADTVVKGHSKSQIVGKLGQPDAKRVFNGREVWEYRKVKFSADNPSSLTVYLTFDGSIVAESVAN